MSFFVPKIRKITWRTPCAVLIVCGLLLFWQTPCPAAQPNARPPASEEGLRFTQDPNAAIAITADEISRDKKRGRIVGSGSAEVRYLGKRIRADRIEVDTSTREGFASGNIVFEAGNDRMVATRVEFNLNTELATISDARGFIGDAYYVTGRLVRRLSEKRYEVQGGTFTTCEGDLPDWAFGFERATFEVEGYAWLETPAMRVRGVPVALLPAAVVPIKTKRATGFLLPGIGTSNRGGFRFSPEFFWAMNDWSDATLGVDYFSKRGVRYKGELRYAPNTDTTGWVSGRYLEDDVERTTFWDVKGAHYARLGNSGADLRSVLDFEKRETTDRSLQSDLTNRTRRHTDAHVTFTQPLPRISGEFRVGMRRREGLNENDGDLFQKAPEVTLDVHHKRLGESDFYFDMNASAAHFRRTEGENSLALGRLHLAPSVSFALHPSPWLGLTPEIGLRQTYWTHQKRDAQVGATPDETELEKTGLAREAWFANLHLVGPRLAKVYEGAFGPFRNFKHVVSFEASYKYSPESDERDVSRIVPLDSVDALGHENVIEYALVNRVFTQVATKDGPQTRQLLRYRISQTYDFREARRDENLSTRSRRPFGDIALRLESHPTPRFRLLQEVKVDPYNSEITEHSTGFLFDSEKNWYLYVVRDWTRRTERNDESMNGSSLNFGGGITLNERLSLEYASRLNKTESSTLEQRLTARYRTCCWGMEIGVSDTREKTDVFLGFSLIGLLERPGAGGFGNRRSMREESGFGGSDSPWPPAFD